MTEDTKENVVEFDPVRALALRHTPPPPDPNKQYPYQLTHFHDLRPGRASPYIVDGLVPTNGLMAVWGPPKSGKSFWTFDLVMHIALGWKYRGRRVEQGPVVYCAFEGAEGFHARAEAFRRTHDEIPKDDPFKPCWFYLLTTNAKLVRDRQALIDSIRGQSSAPPMVVVLDTLNRSIDGSESIDKDMGAYLAAAEAIVDEFWCVVIIVHHSGIDASRPRGHTSLTGAVAVQVSVKRDANGNVITEIEAMKDGPEGATFASQLKVIEVGTDDNGKPLTSCAIIPIDAPAITSTRPKARVTANQQRFLDILANAVVDAPAEHKTMIGGALAISREWLKMCCVAQGWFDESDKENYQRSKLSKMINALAGKRLIGTSKLHVWPVR